MMAERRDMKCAVHDLEVMGSNPSQFKLGVLSTSAEDVLKPNITIIPLTFLTHP